MKNNRLVDFEGKYVVVTGGSSGIGQAISVEISRQGGVPVLIGRDRDRLIQAAAILAGADHRLLVMDLDDLGAIQPTVRELSKEIGRVYGLCHAAGVVDTLPLSACSPDKVKAMMDTNLLAGIELARAVCRRDVMEEAGGSVLFISSIYALIGMPGEIGYSASKGAVVSAARTMAVELARRNIRVNCLSPGLVKTGMTDKAFSLLPEKQRKEIEAAHPLGTGTPEDVARAAVFLLAPQSRWITGVNLVVDGGYTAR